VKRGGVESNDRSHSWQPGSKADAGWFRLGDATRTLLVEADFECRELAGDVVMAAHDDRSSTSSVHVMI
jgi:hypothetical protein